MILELKKLIAVKLLFWAFKVMPDCEFKKSFSKLLATELLNGMD